MEVALQLTRLYKDDPEVLYHTGRLFSNYAYLMTMRLAEVAPTSVWMHQAAGEANESLGSYDAALDEYRKVLALAPGRPGIHYRLGRVFLARARPPLSEADAEADAAREFEQELQIDPTNADAAYELGEIRRKAGDLDKARELFELAVRSYPEFEQGLVGLGRVLVAQGKADLALPPLAKAVSLNPDDDVAWFQLYQAHRALGHLEEQEKAQAEFQRLRSPEARAGAAGPAPPARRDAAGARCAGDPALAGRWATTRVTSGSTRRPTMATTRPRPRFTPALVLGAGASLLLAAPSPLAFAAKGETSLRVVGLRTEYKENPLGIDARTPRLSWRIESDGRGVVQSAYEIRVARSERGLGAAGDRVWESGKVASDESIHRPYGGKRARVRPAVPLAGAGVGRGREGLGLERAGVVGDGASRALGLEGELDRAGPAGGRDEVGSGADAAP